jgi:S-DNA-T family DNA segregation ATPase FtsK/SpoIIIE
MTKEKIEQESPGLAREVFGTIFFAVAVYAAVALFSYTPRDPSFTHGVPAKSSVLNRGGLVGAYLADGLVQALGTGALIFPVVFLAAGWAMIRGGRFGQWPMHLGAGVLFLAAFCSMLGLHFSGDPLFHSADRPGGLVGSLLAGVLAAWLGIIGGTVILTTLLFLSFLTVTGISMNTLIDTGMQGCRWMAVKISEVGLKFASLYQQWEEHREVRKAQEEIEKKSKPKINEPVIITRASEMPGKKIIESRPKKEKAEKAKEKDDQAPPFPIQGDFPFVQELGAYQVPPLSMLNDPIPMKDAENLREEILLASTILEKKLADFGVDGKVVQVLPGPVITLYEFEPAPGVKVSRILSLTDDLALAMRAQSVRFLAPVPGKAVVGIEIPNPKRETVYFKEIISSSAFTESRSKLTLVVGKDHIGLPVVQDLATVPHLLIAGSTGSGKSVGINAMICSILLNATPDEVKMIMIDPKMLELSMYDGIPHLIAPVVTHPKKAAAALQWAVIEMERRYKAMAEKGVRNIAGYNHWVDRALKEMETDKKKKTQEKKTPASSADANLDLLTEDAAAPAPETPQRLPYIVVIIDELADLMMVASKGVEDALARLAQMSRAAGIHLIVATQRPSVDVLTGLIKANFPARVSYQVTSRVDSRTILDCIGAEKLLGKGDMLFMPPGSAKLKRIHGAMVSDEEINGILKFIKGQKKPEYREEDFVIVPETESPQEEEAEMDELYDQAVEVVAREKQASISMLQRRLRVGYNRAARLVEIMEREGVVGPSDGIRPREVYVKPVTFDQ